MSNSSRFLCTVLWAGVGVRQREVVILRKCQKILANDMNICFQHQNKIECLPNIYYRDEELRKTVLGYTVKWANLL